jgi:hypothetical protein
MRPARSAFPFAALNARCAALLFMTLVAACSSVTEQSLAEKGLKPMGNAELKSYLSQPRQARFTSATNQTGTIEYAPDGAIRITTAKGSVAGRWRVDADRFCTQYPELRGGRETCMASYRTGPNEITTFTPEGPTVTVDTN